MFLVPQRRADSQSTHKILIDAESPRVRLMGEISPSARGLRLRVRSNKRDAIADIYAASPLLPAESAALSRCNMKDSARSTVVSVTPVSLSRSRRIRR